MPVKIRKLAKQNQRYCPKQSADPNWQQGANQQAARDQNARQDEQAAQAKLSKYQPKKIKHVKLGKLAKKTQQWYPNQL